MKSIYVLAASATLILTLGGCGGSSSGGGGGGGSVNSAINGTWEAETPEKKEGNGSLKGKVSVTFNNGKYQYSWYKKLVDGSGATVYDWTEIAREGGSVTGGADFMQWTADSFSEAELNAATGKWGALQNKKTDAGYNIAYSVDGNKLTLKEDINLDGDTDDVFDTPETLVYIKK
jgi:hypothetical protein